MTFPDRDRLLYLARTFDDAMLCTVAHDGTIHARPMAILKVDPDQGRWWFVTALDSLKTDELARHPHVTVTMQSSACFLSLTGPASLLQERATLKDLWQPRLYSWFAGGPDDENVALICVDATLGEYWKHGTTDAARREWERIRAAATDHDFDPSKIGEHGTTMLA